MGMLMPGRLGDAAGPRSAYTPRMEELAMDIFWLVIQIILAVLEFLGIFIF